MLELTIDESERLQRVAHALSSDVRLNILKLLNVKQENIVDLADKLNLPVSTVASNVKVLEQAELIVTVVQPASRGTMKLCARTFGDIHMNLNVRNGHQHPKNVYEIEMPVGCYTDSEIQPTCGLINESGYIKPADDPSYFYHPGRVTAQLVWFRQGYVEYKFPVEDDMHVHMQSIQFSMELCSEAPSFNHDWPSDITVWVNDREIGTWTCPGDFGDRRGKLNPHWVPDAHTQYGLLKTWKIDRRGSFLDDIALSGVKLGDIVWDRNKFVKFRIGIKDGAAYVGGINLFGKSFGDHGQDIIMRVIY